MIGPPSQVNSLSFHLVQKTPVTSGAQFLGNDIMVLFEFEQDGQEVRIASERHYRLVPPEELTSADLEKYKQAQLNDD
jgi:hypothetical protein